MAYDKNNTFVLFKNERKETDKHADYKGTFTDEQGREYFMDAWIKTGQNNRKFMSGRVKLKTKQPGGQASSPAPRQAPASAPDDDGSGIPF